MERRDHQSGGYSIDSSVTEGLSVFEAMSIAMRTDLSGEVEEGGWAVEKVGTVFVEVEEGIVKKRPRQSSGQVERR